MLTHVSQLKLTPMMYQTEELHVVLQRKVIRSHTFDLCTLGGPVMPLYLI